MKRNLQLEKIDVTGDITVNYINEKNQNVYSTFDIDELQIYIDELQNKISEYQFMIAKFKDLKSMIGILNEKNLEYSFNEILKGGNDEN